MASFGRPFLIFGLFLLLQFNPPPASAEVLEEDPVPVVWLDNAFAHNGRTAIFFVEKRKETLVGVRLDGVKVVVRSLGGEKPVRIVLDHLSPGRHRVTFRFAHLDQYEFGGGKSFRIRVPKKNLSKFPDQRPDPNLKVQGLSH